MYELELLLHVDKCRGVWMGGLVGYYWLYSGSCTTLQLPQQELGVYLAPHPHQHLLLSVVLTEWVMISVLFALRCLTACTAEPSPACQECTCLVSYLFMFLLHLNLGLPFSCWFSRILCIPWINALYHVCLLQMFSPRLSIISFSSGCGLHSRVCRPAYHRILEWIVYLWWLWRFVRLVMLTGFPITMETRSSVYFWGFTREVYLRKEDSLQIWGGQYL